MSAWSTHRDIESTRLAGLRLDGNRIAQRASMTPEGEGGTDACAGSDKALLPRPRGPSATWRDGMAAGQVHTTQMDAVRAGS